ncbi:hypothetical protein ACGO3R_08315 [Lactococcus lactis]
MDVPIKKQAEIYLNETFFLIDAPKVEKRGFLLMMNGQQREIGRLSILDI